MEAAVFLLAVQGLLGAFDTIYYHELKLHLAQSVSDRRELQLHAGRDFIYVPIFGFLAWFEWRGVWACVLLGLLTIEITITLCDFIEEDKVRKVPGGERAMHALMGIIYGAFLALIIPEIFHWSGFESGFRSRDFGWLNIILTAMAFGVLISGVRDLIASRALVMNRLCPTS